MDPSPRETQAPGNKSMRQSNAFLRRYYTEPEFRAQVLEEGLVTLWEGTPQEIKRLAARQWAREQRLADGWKGPKVGRTPQERNDAKKERYKDDPEFQAVIKARVELYRKQNPEKVAESRRLRYASDEGVREKQRVRRLVRTARDRALREAAKAESEAARKLAEASDA